MDAYAGEVQSMHPFYAFDSPARANDMDLATTNAVSSTLLFDTSDMLTRLQYALPGNITAGIQHGSWTMPLEKGKAPSPSFLNSNSQHVLEDLHYTTEDIKHVEDWTKRMSFSSVFIHRDHITDTSQATSKPPGTPWVHVPWHPGTATASSSMVC